MCQRAGIATSRDQAEKNTRLATAGAGMHMLGVLASTAHRQYAWEAALAAATAAVATPTRAGACGVSQVACFLPCHLPPAAGPTRTTAAAAARGPPPPGVSALDPHTATCQSCCPCHVAPPAPSLPCGTRRTVCVLQLGSHPRSGTTYVPVPRQLIAWRIQLASSRLLCHIDSGLPPNATPPSPPHRHSSLALAYLQQQHGGEG